MPDTHWTPAGPTYPEPFKMVALRVKESNIPKVGWFLAVVPGPVSTTSVRAAWTVPGYGGTVTHWCDCIPPWPDPPPPEKAAIMSITTGP